MITNEAVGHGMSAKCIIYLAVFYSKYYFIYSDRDKSDKNDDDDDDDDENVKC